MKQKLVTICIILFSILCGVITKDYFLGTAVLICGLLDSYYASLGKISNYVFGALYCLLSGYICYINGLYGLAILSFVIYFPSQILGIIHWLNKRDKNDDVKVRGFTIKNSIAIVSLCIISSFLLGLLLNKIPNQQLAFFDASSNIINLCGIVLLNLRFKECWSVWLFSNSIDVCIWTINVINKSSNSIMMLIVSIGYLIINFYGLIVWYKKHKKTKYKRKKG